MERRNLVQDSVWWRYKNKLQLNAAKTRVMVLDFWRLSLPPQPVLMDEADVHIVGSLKYLSHELENNLDWWLNTDAIYRK